MSKEVKPLIYYYARRGWYNQLTNFCEALRVKKQDPFNVFWKAFGQGMCGNISASLGTLDLLQSRKDMQYPVTIARLYFHRRARNIDYEAIDVLSSELSIAEEITKEAGFVFAARFLLFSGDFEEAVRIADKLLAGKSGDTSTVFELEATTIQQWCFMADLEDPTKESPSDAKKRLTVIDSGYRSKGNVEAHEIDSLMAWAKSRHILNLNNDVLNILNQVIALYPAFLPALGDKALLLASAGEWEQALDTAQRLDDIEKEKNLDALEVFAVHAFTQDSYVHEAVDKFERFDKVMRKLEPSSIEYTVDVVTLFSSICSRQPAALTTCVSMLKRLLDSNLSSMEEARVFAEIGCIQTMQGPMQFENAMKSFRDAIQRDNNNVRALEGMILCQLCEGLVEDAESQIELVLLMQGSEQDDLGYGFLYLQSLLLRNKKDGKKGHLEALNTCLDAFSPKHNRDGTTASAHVKPYMNSFHNIRATNPDFTMLLASDYLSHSDPSASLYISTSGSGDSASSLQGQLAIAGASAAGNEESKESRANEAANNIEISPAVQSGLELLNRVIRICPGTICAYVEVSRCYSSMGLFEEASRALNQCLAMQPNCAPVLLALAKVEISRGKLTSADRVLEQALASDFSIRSVPLFKLIKALVRLQQSRYDESLTEIEQLLALPEFGFTLGAKDNMVTHSSSSMFSTNYADSMRLTEEDRVGAFVVYASLLSKLRRLKEANKVLGHAKVTFAGTPQEVQVLVAASQMYVEKGDFDSAIRMLDKISEDSPTYSRAQIIKADIILINNHDKEGYTRCYQQLADKDPSSRNFSLLGEAYLRILNPEAAIDALERAYKLDPANSRLRARIGRSLVSTHEYHRAVEFYESAIREIQKNNKTGTLSSDVVSLSHDLARLYIKLNRAPNSIRVLNSILHDSPSDLTELRQDVATLLLLTKVQNFNNSSDSLNTFLRAYDLQKEVVVKVRSSVSALSSADVIDAEKIILSTICDKIGAIHVELRDNAAAESKLNEAVQYNLQNIQAMTGLARLYHGRGDRDQCIAQCNKIITAVPSAEEAAILLSDIQFQSEEPEAADLAINPLLNLLKLQPNNYTVLDKAINLLRRAGKLEVAKECLKEAEKNDRRCTSHAGYHYSQGLYARYTNDIGKSISEFNLARKDDVWGPVALVHMIELFLNPDQEGVWEEKESGPVGEGTRSNIAAAEQLLSELRPIAKDEKRVRILENYCSLSTRIKLNVDKAMQNFSELLDQNPDYLPAVLGMATGFMIDKNQHKARNLLKRVGKMELNQHDGEDFEKANLLLAKFYIDKGKNDLAQELCRKTLLQNKSCSQAWEILGLIFEKEGNYESAADAYEKAWKLEFEASASVGFKLAFSYLKCRKLVESIDICEKVLALYPDYPRISEEILKKAQQSFRSTVAL